MSKYWNVTKFGATADPLHVDVHDARIAKDKTCLLTLVLTLSLILRFSGLSHKRDEIF